VQRGTDPSVEASGAHMCVYTASLLLPCTSRHVSVMHGLVDVM
jgi:hypothetical protein